GEMSSSWEATRAGSWDGRGEGRLDPASRRHGREPRRDLRSRVPRPLRILGVFVLAVALVPLSGMPRAGAATLTVDSTADLPDTDLGDGVCSTAEASCTLRAAVEQAEALGGAHTIVVPAGIYALAAP